MMIGCISSIKKKRGLLTWSFFDRLIPQTESARNACSGTSLFNPSLSKSRRKSWTRRFLDITTRRSISSVLIPGREWFSNAESEVFAVAERLILRLLTSWIHKSALGFSKDPRKISAKQSKRNNNTQQQLFNSNYLTIRFYLG